MLSTPNEWIVEKVLMSFIVWCRSRASSSYSIRGREVSTHYHLKDQLCEGK